ncbi:MAG: CGNR zinc finger domain-containing protein, partial [Pseudomonadota bacterium]
PRGDGVGYAEGTTLSQIVALNLAAMVGAPGTLKQLKMCKADNCGWFFLDQSRTKRRVWCCMETCGNRAKARRFSARERAGAGAAQH